jgi:hypothetical protein
MTSTSHTETVLKNSVSQLDESELKEIIAYIAEREQSLSNYSDKLRTAVKRIFQQFGDQCRVCGESSARHFALLHCYSVEKIDSRTREEERKACEEAMSCHCGSGLSEEERKRIRGANVENAMRRLGEMHQYRPAIKISIDVQDSVAFRIATIDDMLFEYMLALHDSNLVINRIRVDDEKHAYFSDAVEEYKSPSRETLKDLVKSERLISFLRIVKEKIEATSEEYAQVSKLAEKLAASTA